MATLRRQCWLFAIGSTLFALATVPGMSATAGAGLSNALCFIGSWFFTAAGWMQLLLAGPSLSIGWYSAATQFVGTVLFNISTGAALWAHAVKHERRLVWTPGMLGSAAFLVSGVLGVVAVTVVVGYLELRSRDWQAEWIWPSWCRRSALSSPPRERRRTRCWPTSARSSVHCAS